MIIGGANIQVLNKNEVVAAVAYSAPVFIEFLLVNQRGI
jgi:hypothetical protein